MKTQETSGDPITNHWFGPILNWLLVPGFALFLVSFVTAYGQNQGSKGGPASNQAPKTAPATEQVLSSYEGQKVTGIEIAGHPELASSEFAALFVQHAGEPFSKEKVDATVAALKATGKFKEVQLQIDPEGDGVRILLVLEPAVFFGIFQFPGAEQFEYSRLVQVANFPPEAPFNADDIERDRQSLVNFFREQGFFQAEVRTEVQTQKNPDIANVVFHVTLHRRAKFGQIEIANITPEESTKLIHSLQTLLARGRGVAIRPGKTYRRGTLTRATQYLMTQLEKRGRLSAQVQLEGAEYHAETHRADIHFKVEEGPLVKVEITGAHLWSWNRKALLPVYQGVGVDEESVQEGRQALVSHFQAKGFFDVKVDAQLKQEASGDTILYQISKDKKHKVRSVLITGNKEIATSDLTNHVTVKKAHLFSPGAYSEQTVRASAKNLAAVYESEGYSSVKVVPAISRADGNIVVTFRVTEGPRDIVNSLQIEGADTLPQSDLAPAGLKLAAGKPYSQKFVQADRANIVAAYLKAGYLTSSFRQTATVVSKSDPHHINVVYHIYEGPKVFAGDVITLGRSHTKQRLIDQDIASIHREQPLTETQLLTAESMLYDHSGVFDWAEVDPRRQITTQTKEDILVKVHEARKNQITYGFGFEVINRGGSIPSGTVALPNLPPVGLPSTFKTSQTTFVGPRGTFQYTRNNFRGKGESLSFTAFAGRLDQRIAAYYINPNFRWSPWKATTSFSAERNEQNPVFSSQQELGSFQLQRYLGKARANTLFLRYSFSKTDLTRIEIPDLVLAQDQHVRLSTVAANLTRDTRDNVLDAHKGVLRSVELDFSGTKLGSSVSFAKLTAQTAYYKSIFHNIVWANSLRVGLAQPLPGSRIPISEAYFTGGGKFVARLPS